MATQPDHLRGVLLTLSGVVILSPDGLILRLIETDRWTLLWWRGVLLTVGLALFLVGYYQRAVLTRVLAIGRPGILAAFLFSGSTLLFVAAMTLTTVANTLVLISVVPLFAAILSYVFLRERIALRTSIAAGVVLIGIATIFSGSLGGGALIGDLCALATAVCLAGNFVVVRYARAVDMAPAVALSGVFVMLVVWPLAAPSDVSDLDLNLLLLLGMLILPVSFYLITSGPRYLPVPEVSLIMLFESVLGPLWVWLALGEQPSLETLLGGGLILLTLATHSAAGLMFARNPVRPTRPPALPVDLATTQELNRRSENVPQSGRRWRR